MKRYWIMGVLALTAMVYLASCSDHDIDTTSTIDARKQRFDEVFKKVFGNDIDPEQDWGFWNGQSQELARTRSTNKESHNWASQGLVQPTALTDAQKQDVANYFATHKFSGHGATLDWTDYWVEFVSRTDTTTAIRERSDGSVDTWAETYTFDLISVHNGSDYEDILDWNANVHPTYYLENVTTNNFRVWLSYTSQWDYDWTIQQYNGEYYLAFDLYGEKSDNGTVKLGTKSRGYYNDYIIRLKKNGGSSDTPSGPNTTETADKKEVEFLNEYGRVFCEDLGLSVDTANSRKDLDYNDAVFDVYNYYKNIFTKVVTRDTVRNGDDVTINTTETWVQTGGPVKSRTQIVLQAAGGTIPLQVAGKEVHELFNVGVATMVNTVRNETDAYGSYTTRDPVSFNTDIPYGSIDSIPIVVRYTDEVGELTAYEGTAPMKLCTPAVSTMWAAERQGIGDAYPQFKDYVKDHYTYPWDSPNPDFLYTGATTVYVPEYNITGEEVELSQSMTLSNANDLTISSSHFSLADGAATVYIYGEARSGAEINAYAGDSDTPIQGSYARTRSVVQSLAFTLNGNDLEKAKTKGVVVKGKNFVVHKASVNELEPPVPDRQGTVIWEGDQEVTAINGISLSSSLFAGAGRNTIIRVYGIGKKRGDDIWHVYLTQNNNSYDNLSGTSAKNSNGDVGAYELTWKLDNKEAAEQLLTNGLLVRGVVFKVKYITVDNSLVEPDLPTIQGNTIWGIGSQVIDWTSPTVYLDADFLSTKGIGIGTVVRIYGIGLENGWQVKATADWEAFDISGWALDTSSGKYCLQNYWSNNNQNGAFELEFTLTETTARLLLEKGLRFSGEKFNVKCITVDNTSAEIVPNFTLVSGSSWVNGITTTALSASSTVSVSKDNFTNADAGTTVYVYGVTQGNPSVTVNGITAVNNARTRASGEAKIMKVEMNATQAANATANGVTIAGSNFRLYKVSVKLVEKEDEPDPEPTGDEKTLYSTNSPVAETNTFKFDPYKFTNISANDVMRIYADMSTYKTYGWYITITGKDGTKQKVSNWTQDDGTKISNSDPYPWKSNDSYMEIKLDANLVNMFKTHGMQLLYYWCPITKITIATSGTIPASDPTAGGGTQIWPDSGTGSETSGIELAGSKFNSASSTGRLRIYATFKPNEYWSTTMNFPDWSVVQNVVSATNWSVGYQALTATELARVENPSSIVMPLNATLVAKLKEKGAKFNFGNITVTRIVLEN